MAKLTKFSRSMCRLLGLGSVTVGFALLLFCFSSPNLLQYSPRTLVSTFTSSSIGNSIVDISSKAPKFNGRILNKSNIYASTDNTDGNRDRRPTTNGLLSRPSAKLQDHINSPRKNSENKIGHYDNIQNKFSIDFSVRTNHKADIASNLHETSNDVRQDVGDLEAIGSEESLRETEQLIHKQVEKVLSANQRAVQLLTASHNSTNKTIAIPKISDIYKQERRTLSVELSRYSPHPSLGVRNTSQLVPELGGRPVRNIVLTTWRSGSTFLGDVLLAHPGTFYHYEPLLDFDIHQVRSGDSAQQALHNLDHLLRCNYTDMGHYLNYGMGHQWLHSHNKRLWWVCFAFKKFCANPQFLSGYCKLFPFQSMKIVRLRMSLTEQFLRDDTLDVRVVLLVRDPRGTMQSRRHREWCPGMDDCDNPQRLCEDLQSDYHAALKLDKLFPGKIRVVRYEDLSFNSRNLTRDLFDFFRLTYVDSVGNFLDTHTKTKKGDESSTFRDSRVAPVHWRTDLTFPEVEEIQGVCEEAMSLFGYRMASDAQHLADLDAIGDFIFPST